MSSDCNYAAGHHFKEEAAVTGEGNKSRDRYIQSQFPRAETRIYSYVGMWFSTSNPTIWYFMHTLTL